MNTARLSLWICHVLLSSLYMCFKYKWQAVNDLILFTWLLHFEMFWFKADVDGDWSRELHCRIFVSNEAKIFPEILCDKNSRHSRTSQLVICAVCLLVSEFWLPIQSTSVTDQSVPHSWLRYFNLISCFHSMELPHSSIKRHGQGCAPYVSDARQKL
jgi:hypothetical protein